MKTDERKSPVVFKWVCLLVAVIALSVFGWMLNDIRLQVHRTAEKADNLAEKADKQLPAILNNAERVSAQLDKHLPVILADAESAVDSLSAASQDLDLTRGLLGRGPGAPSDEKLATYGESILGLIARQPDATIGVVQPSPGAGLKKPVPAKAWAAAHRGDPRILSTFAASEPEVLHGLARTFSAAPLHIQLPGQVPRLLADWLQEESRKLPL
jgi:hypothetical protein